MSYSKGYFKYYQYAVVQDIAEENYFKFLEKLSIKDRYQFEMDIRDYGFVYVDIYAPRQGEIAHVFGSGGGIQIRLGVFTK